MGTFRLHHFQLLIKRIFEDDVFGRAAQLAYFFLLSLFPLLIFLVTLVSYLPITEEQIMDVIADFAPEEMMIFIEKNLNEIMAKQNGTLLSIGIIGTLWSASNGMNRIMQALNQAYGVQENRSFFISRGLAIVFTIVMIFIFILALLLPVFGMYIGSFLFIKLGLSEHFFSFWNTIRWFLSFIILFIVFLVLYWLVPNKRFKCLDAFPGAIFSTVGWLLVSYGFSYYVNNFADYSAMYGSIGVVIVLMIWFYLLGLTIIIGGEINAFSYRQREHKC